MKEAIDILQKHKYNMAAYNDDHVKRIDRAIRVLSLHNRTQEVQVPRELHSEGINGLINSLESMRASGINAIEIVNCEDGSLKIKELK